MRHVLKRRREWTHDLCSRYLQPNEICLYVFQCSVDLARTQLEKAIEELEETLVTMRTSSTIIKVWKPRLLGWHDQTQFPFSLFSLGEKTYDAVKEQD